MTPAAYGKSDLRAQLTKPLWTLTAIGVGVLIIACANVANLLLARAGARRREIAVRLALGASRRRVVRQLLIESLLLALAGGAAGLALATWGAQSLLAFFSDPGTTLTVTPWPDARILAVNVAVCVVVGVLFGLAPAFQSTRPDVGAVLKAESIGVLGGGYARLRQGLVVTQVALSLLLLVGAGLFLKSLNNLLAVDAGFETARLLSFSVAPGEHGYAPAETKTFARTLLDRIRATPGIAGAGFVSHTLLEGGSWNSTMTIEGRKYDPDARVLTLNNLISPGYFDAMGIRRVAGRDFDARDEKDSPPGSTRIAAARGHRERAVRDAVSRRARSDRHPHRIRPQPGNADAHRDRRRCHHRQVHEPAIGARAAAVFSVSRSPVDSRTHDVRADRAGAGVVDRRAPADRHRDGRDAADV